METDKKWVVSSMDIFDVFSKALSILAWKRGGALANSLMCTNESLVLEGIGFVISKGRIDTLILLWM